MSTGHKKGASAAASSRRSHKPDFRKTQDATPTDLTKVGYVVCPVEKRSSLLFTFLKRNRNGKVVVLFNSTASAKFHGELFGRLGLETTVIDIKEKRSKVAERFRGAAFTILCRYDSIVNCEEVTATLDRCVLYEPVNALRKIPDKLLVVLQPYETGFLDHLRRSFPVDTEELKFAWSKIADVQPQIEKLVSETYSLNTAAREAFKDYMRGYNDLDPKGLFNVKNVELKKLCRSFGLKVPVAVDLTDADKNVSERRAKRKGGEGYAYYVPSVEGSKKSEYRQTEEAKKMKIYKPVKSKKRRL